MSVFTTLYLLLKYAFNKILYTYNYFLYVCNEKIFGIKVFKIIF